MPFSQPPSPAFGPRCDRSLAAHLQAEVRGWTRCQRLPRSFTSLIRPIRRRSAGQQRRFLAVRRTARWHRADSPRRRWSRRPCRSWSGHQNLNTVTPPVVESKLGPSQDGQVDRLDSDGSRRRNRSATGRLSRCRLTLPLLSQTNAPNAAARKHADSGCRSTHPRLGRVDQGDLQVIGDGRSAGVEKFIVHIDHRQPFERNRQKPLCRRDVLSDASLRPRRRQPCRARPGHSPAAGRLRDCRCRPLAR